MTIPSEVDVVVTPDVATGDERSYVDWPAIIAGTDRTFLIGGKNTLWQQYAARV